eukprot:SAG22_NODE_1333_length_4674_cov_5.765319_6_plen_53_part_01
MGSFCATNGWTVSKIIETAMETLVVYTPSVNGDTCAHPARPLELNKCHTARQP